MSGAEPLRFQASPDQVRDVRQRARELAAQLGAAAEVCDAMALVVDELVNNAIEHGEPYRRAGHELSVAIWRDDRRLVLDFRDPEMPCDEVRDLAIALRDAATGLPALDSERGRGLFLITVYLDEVTVDEAADGGLHLRGSMAG